MTRNFDQICSQLIGEMIAPNTGAQAAVAQNAQQKPAAPNPNDQVKQLTELMKNKQFAEEFNQLLSKYVQQPKQQQTAPQQQATPQQQAAPQQQQAQQPNAAAPKK